MRAQLISCLGVVLWLIGGSGHGQQQDSELFARPAPGTAQLKVLDRLVGTWEVTVRSRRPRPGTMKYSETYDWVLDRRFIRGETVRKPDGTADIYMATYEPATRHYHFWIFNSQGTFVEIPTGTWNETAREMEWKSGPGSPLALNGRWIFLDANTRLWTTEVKDWKGKVLLDVEGRAVRRP
jgi:Protein of unknown function (DUF1579)